jgi:hypothetical protein
VEIQGQLAPQVQLVQLALKAFKASPALLGQLEQLAQLVQPGLLQQLLLALLPLALKEQAQVSATAVRHPLPRLTSRFLVETLVQPGLLALLVQLVQQVLPVLLALLVPLAQQAHKAFRATLDQQARPDLLVQLVQLAQQQPFLSVQHLLDPPPW